MANVTLCRSHHFRIKAYVNSIYSSIRDNSTAYTVYDIPVFDIFSHKKGNLESSLFK